MICFPHAKINLGLNIISKRPDGYHNLETVFYPVTEIQDALEIVPAQDEKGIFRQSGIAIDGNPSDNLVMKAYRLLAEKYPLPELDVYLYKNIPFGAGLGGGSADAAFMLNLLNNYAQLNIPASELEELAAQIGADCAFFVQSKPVFATGIGNVFEPVNLSLDAYQISIVKPEVHVSTKDAYANIVPQQPKISLKEIIQLPVEEWKHTMVNDFEESVFSKYPQIQTVKEDMYQQGALYASMSGSGSAVFGIFKK